MNSPASHPVTVLITRRVRPGRDREFDAATAAMIAAASAFPGHLGGYVLRPEGEASNLRQTLFAFDTQDHLDAWTAADARRDILADLAAVSDGDTAVHVLTGLEGWFALPSQPTRLPPPRWKMALVTWTGIFPLVAILSSLLSPTLATIHPLFAVLVVTGLVTAAMTWAVMPVLVRAAAKWLYPDLAKPAAGR